MSLQPVPPIHREHPIEQHRCKRDRGVVRHPRAGASFSPASLQRHRRALVTSSSVLRRRSPFTPMEGVVPFGGMVALVHEVVVGCTEQSAAPYLPVMRWPGATGRTLVRFTDRGDRDPRAPRDIPDRSRRGHRPRGRERPRNPAAPNWLPPVMSYSPGCTRPRSVGAAT